MIEKQKKIISELCSIFSISICVCIGNNDESMKKAFKIHQANEKLAKHNLVLRNRLAQVETVKGK
jgi:hypothetical protein